MHFLPDALPVLLLLSHYPSKPKVLLFASACWCLGSRTWIWHSWNQKANQPTLRYCNRVLTWIPSEQCSRKTTSPVPLFAVALPTPWRAALSLFVSLSALRKLSASPVKDFALLFVLKQRCKPAWLCSQQCCTGSLRSRTPARLLWTEPLVTGIFVEYVYGFIKPFIQIF